MKNKHFQNYNNKNKKKCILALGVKSSYSTPI